MNELAKDAAAIDVTDLLTRYSFDLGGSTVERLVNSWLHQYPTQWLRLAVIEALYQGRYKAFSVEQILNLWKRRGRSLYRFNHEFERIVCGRFPTSTYGRRSPALNSVRSQPFYPVNAPAPVPGSSPQPNYLHSSTSPAEEPRAESPATSAFSPAQSAEVESSAPPAVSEPSDPVELTSVAGNVEGQPIEGQEHDGLDSESDQDALTLPKGSPVQTFKPATSIELGILEIGVARSHHREPIHQFTPTPESSDFYSKLRAVAQIQN
ncbi:hypothetical protein [Egbenema bharatensis]|uniref:hypothetical protein n=1 Tax=Egbenema bharatensis TaxID=3463334 RepID=UPI003A88A18F